MKSEEILKLERKLGHDYCLVPCEKGTWILIRGSVNSRIIMSSDVNTDDELRKFVKEHTIYDVSSVIAGTGLIINAIVVLLAIANTFINSHSIRFFILGTLFVLIPILIINTYMINSNGKIFKKTIEEDINDRRKHSSTKTRTRKPRKKVEEKKD